MQPVLISWSGGKDSCLALYEVQKAQGYNVAALLTTVTSDYERVSMHGVRRALLARQAASLGLPVHEVFIGKDATNEEYEASMGEALSSFREQGVEQVVFGDLFLEDVRAYRDRLLARHGMQGVYPVWLRDTAGFIREFIELGFKAVVTCVNTEALDPSFAGAVIDEEFLRALPPGVDPCGEKGEFHSFVFDGPLFRKAVAYRLGERVFRGPFCFRDLLPGC